MKTYPYRGKSYGPGEEMRPNIQMSIQNCISKGYQMSTTTPVEKGYLYGTGKREKTGGIIRLGYKVEHLPWKYLPIWMIYVLVAIFLLESSPPAFWVKGLPLGLFIPILVIIKHSLKEGLSTKTRSISGTYTDQYYLKNQDPTLPREETVYQDWRKSTLLDRCTVCAIDSLALPILEALPGVTKPEDWSVEVGFLRNCKVDGEVHQTLHLDVPEAENLKEKTLLPYIVHIPLCTEGMALQVVSTNREDNPPNFCYYRFGEAAVLQVDGGCYGTKENICMRIYISHKNFPENRGNENLLHKRCGLPDKKTWPAASSILKLSQESDVKLYHSLWPNWYRNRLVSTMKVPEYLSLDLLSNV
jgi:hypothetical protein